MSMGVAVQCQRGRGGDSSNNPHSCAPYLPHEHSVRINVASLGDLTSLHQLWRSIGRRAQHPPTVIAQKGVPLGGTQPKVCHPGPAVCQAQQDVLCTEIPMHQRGALRVAVRQG